MKKLLLPFISLIVFFSCNDEKTKMIDSKIDIKSTKEEVSKNETEESNTNFVIENDSLEIKEEISHKTDSNFTLDELKGKGQPNLVRKNGYILRPEVAEAFEKMKKAAQNDGFNIHVISSYRTFDYQKGIWNRKFNSNKNLSVQQNVEKIIEYSTIPGTSRHHWGTDLDIIHSINGIPDDPLNEKHFNKGGSMEKFKLWLDNNSEKFGFYLVYTNNSKRNGFKYEPWHFTYKPLSDKMFKLYQLEDLKEVLLKENLNGKEAFTNKFIQKYFNENLLDINPQLK